MVAIQGRLYVQSIKAIKCCIPSLDLKASGHQPLEKSLEIHKANYKSDILLSSEITSYKEVFTGFDKLKLQAIIYILKI